MSTIDLNEVIIRSYSSLVALVFLAWDLVVTFGDEYEYVWKQNWTPVKCIYLFCRYFSLVAQIVNYVIAQGPISRVPVAHAICKAWYTFQSLSTTSLLCSVNALLMLRIYALYDWSRRIAIFLVILFFVDVISLSTQGLHLCVNASIFDQACLMVETPPGVLGPSIEILVVQGALWGMTWWKSNRSQPWTRTPLLNLVMRDGAFVFVGIFAILVITIPYALLVKSVGHFFFPWFTSLLAFAACKLTINLLRLDTLGASTQDDLELTSVIEVPLNHRFYRDCDQDQD
ncbi:hypothetical protein BD779DRAFT_1025932 [Infundibulicybe gibba]|nr:hypothetical protein BD779DRAFT_1025932 [Infundibulicybe gibba]